MHAKKCKKCNLKIYIYVYLIMKFMIFLEILYLIISRCIFKHSYIVFDQTSRRKILKKTLYLKHCQKWPNPWLANVLNFSEELILDFAGKTESYSTCCKYSCLFLNQHSQKYKIKSQVKVNSYSRPCFIVRYKYKWLITHISVLYYIKAGIYRTITETKARLACSFWR